ncbi:MAG: VOC family protein [Maricaulaceae bacterium]|jgi:hydroxymethylpyrimidine/phosphomethylpyrimidine kinase
MRLNQVTVPVTDYAASVAFYRSLGLVQIVDSPPRYARFECPDADGGEPATFSLHADPSVRPGEGALVYFEVDDLDALIARLKAEGADVLSEPRDMDYLWREADVRDPSGNRIRLYTAGENRRFPPWRIGTQT